MMQKNIRGLSLIELLVSMVISGIILAGVVNVVVSSKVTFIAEEENSFIQENARYVMETLMRDARLAGAFGCADLTTALVGNAVSDSNADGILSTSPITGYEGSSSTSEFPDSFASSATVGSDAVIFRYADDSSAVETSAHETGPNKINTSSKTDLPWDKGDVLAIVDVSCRHVSIFRATSDTSSGKHIFHKATGPDKNCTNFLKATITNFDCECLAAGTCSSTNSAFDEGSRVMQLVANSYYIGSSNLIANMPALKRVTVTSSGTRTDELAQGVEAMNIIYGVDLNDDGDVQRFVVADDVADWNSVRALRLSLTFRSQAPFYDSNNAITLNGVEYNDRYLRQVANVTVRLRNR